MSPGADVLRLNFRTFPPRMAVVQSSAALAKCLHAILSMQQRSAIIFGQASQDAACGAHSIYGWAGEYRQVNVSKGGFLFAAAGLVPRLIAEFESDCLMRHTPLLADGRSDIALSLAETHTEFLLIHPFREGNGRLARLLAILMSLQAGLRTPAFEIMIERRRLEYFAAVRAGVDRNYEPMRQLFASIIGGGEV